MVEGGLLLEKESLINCDLVAKIQDLDAGEVNLKVICEQLAEDITKREKSFPDLVESLECLLTSPELSKHNIGVDVLARVCQGLPRDFLMATELELISQFFCSQIKQHHSFLSTSLKGLLAVVQSDKLTMPTLHEITSTLFTNVVWQTQPLADRNNFYSILQFITFNWIEEFKSTSSEFLFSIISSLDGERDPRNLLLLFSFLPHLFMSIPLGALAEDAFEVVSCYFPIDFYSASSSPDAVTRENLVEGLMPCLLAVPEFSNFCFPLIREKLDSTLKTAKIDSYKLLIEGCQVWEPGCVVPHMEWLWNAIMQDTLPPRDIQTADFATQALQAIVRATPEASLSVLLNKIIYRCELFLSEAQMSLFEPSSKLLLATMEACPLACRIVSCKLLPKLVSLLRVTQDASRIIVLNKSLTFTEACLNHKVDFGSEAEAWKGLQLEILDCLNTGGPQVKEVALKALTLLSPHLGADIRVSLYPDMLALLVSNQPSSLRVCCIKCLQSLTLMYEREVQLNIIEHLIIKERNGEDLALKQFKFGAICNLAVVESLHPLLEQQFTTLMDQGGLSTSVAVCGLRDLLEKDEIQKNNALVNFLFSQSSVLQILTSAEINDGELVDAAKVVQTLVRLQSSREQERIVSPLVERLLQQRSQTHQIVMLEALVCPLWPEVSLLTTSLDDIFRVVITAATSLSENTLLVNSGLRLLSTLINKTGNVKLVESVAEHLNGLSKQQATTVHAYITKALCSRGHPTMEHWVNKLVDLLDAEVESEAEAAADGVRLVVEESEGWLSAQNHCQVRLLFRQRFFTLVCPRLVCSTRKTQHLKALSYILQSVPSTVYEKGISEIVPLLVLSLDMDCEQLLLIVLHILANLLTSENRVFLESQVDTFIPRFLNLSRSCPFMKVRIAALKCLSNTLKFSPVLLLPLKQKVIAELVPCLDDKKRLVRKEAATTRSKWFLLGAPAADT